MLYHHLYHLGWCHITICHTTLQAKLPWIEVGHHKHLKGRRGRLSQSYRHCTLKNFHTLNWGGRGNGTGQKDDRNKPSRLILDLKYPYLPNSISSLLFDLLCKQSNSWATERDMTSQIVLTQLE